MAVNHNRLVVNTGPIEINTAQPGLTTHFAHFFTKKIKSYRKLVKAVNQEAGSISVVVIGLFVITVACLMVMTDVGTLIVAKRSLVQATEAAAQRGVHTLNKNAYYQGKANIFTVPAAIAANRPHPVIPIDCARGSFEVLLELHSWSNDNTGMKWQQLKEIQLTDFQCDGERLDIRTRSGVNLPFKIPFSSTTTVFLNASAGTSNQVQAGFYLFGVRIR